MKILRNNIAVIEGDSHIGHWVQQSGRLDHDQYLLPMLMQYIPAGGVVVDAGAYIGDHTIAYARKVGATGKVLAFEPNPAAFECLAHNMRNAAQVECYNIGLSAGVQTATLEIPNENFGMATLKNTPGDIICRPLDSVELPRLNFMKIDVEGFELEVLKGAEKTIRQHRPVMLIEINTHTLAQQQLEPTDIYKYLDGIGYSYVSIQGGDLKQPQFDLLCKPK